MGGAVLAQIDPKLKIKGGRWTVFKFFTVSVAYTSVWLAVSSELGYYRELYGPQVLLLLNIAYYAPSIPLLILSSFFDEALEEKLGLARTILVRLVVGLVGYGVIAAGFPFLPAKLGVLLSTVVALGLFSSIAFSASYQMVARFANKNVIALGLGCTASGPIILILQLSLGIKAIPTFGQQITLFMLIFVLVLAGLWATVSLLLRHWDAIEASAAATTTTTEPNGYQAGEPDLSSPLLGSDTETGALAISETPRFGGSLARPSPRPNTTLFREPSLPLLLAYNLLEPYETFLSVEDDWQARVPNSSRRRTSGSREGSQRGPRRENSQNLLQMLSSPRENITFNGITLPVGEPESMGASPVGTVDGFYTPRTDNAAVSDEGSESSLETISGVAALVQTGKEAWPALLAIGLQAGIALTLFPFFTYLPSSGRFGDELPAVLFFVRIFCDIFGRMLPRAAQFKPVTIWPVLAVALVKLATEPLFFLYLKSSEGWHSDILAAVYIGVMWAAGGYVNTAANMVAPHLVQPQYKSTAMALMALVYQLGHFLGLAFAAVLAHVLFGAM